VVASPREKTREEGESGRSGVGRDIRRMGREWERGEDEEVLRNCRRPRGVVTPSIRYGAGRLIQEATAEDCSAQE